MANFLSELKRRNVFKVATIYVVVSWLLLQVATIIFPVFEIPMWASRLVVLLLAAGFPVALIMAWAFDLTPGGIEWDSEVGEQHVHTHVWDWVLGVLLVVAIGLIVSTEIRNWQLSGEESSVDSAPTADAPDPDPEPGPNPVVARDTGIAVLPFVNMSGDPENEYFSDGLTEEILNLLAKVPELKVIGRTSSFAFKGRNEDLRDIGSTLGVGNLLEGSVRKSGDEIRVTAQLIDATDGSHIWSETYDRTLTDIFEVQDDVAASIIDALQIFVASNPTRGRPTESTDAFALFLKARIAANEYEWRTSEMLLQQAIDTDPLFAEAHELLAYVYWAMSGTLYDSAEAQKLSSETAAVALELDPDLALAGALKRAGDVDSYSMREKLEAFDIAARRQPDDERILDIYWYLLTMTGYMSEALEIAERRLDVDPISISAHGRMPSSLFGVGRVEDGFRALGLFDQMDPHREYWYVGEANLVYGRDEEAIRVFENNLREGGSTETDWIAELVAGGRDPVSGQVYLDRRIPEIVASVPAEFAAELERDLAYWYLYFGHLDPYFDLIFALEPNNERWSDAEDLVTTATGYRNLGFTAHPKYLHVAEQLGFFEVWDERGAPDFCRKTDQNWICD